MKKIIKTVLNMTATLDIMLVQTSRKHLKKIT